MPSPIRLAITGLSSSAATSWASGAHLPYLLSPRGLAKYKIVALLNSSVDAASRAIEHYKLDPSQVKAYGDPQALADDPDVDLVVNCTRVDVHHSSVLASVKAGKDVFVEWPLAQDVQHARELAGLVQEKGSRSVVGLQGRVAPPVVKICELLEQGTIGKVLSSEVRGFGGTNDRESLPPGLAYFTDRSVGGNVYMIGYGHREYCLPADIHAGDLLTITMQCLTSCSTYWESSTTFKAASKYRDPKSAFEVPRRC